MSPAEHEVVEKMQQTAAVSRTGTKVDRFSIILLFKAENVAELSKCYRDLQNLTQNPMFKIEQTRQIETRDVLPLTSDYAKLNTDLARHHRCKEELSAQAKGEDLIGNSLEGFTVVRRPLQF